MTFLGQLFRRARSSGIAVYPDLAPAEFRAKRSKRGRDERVIPPRSAVEVFFSQPIFTGCMDWDRPHEHGPHIFHRGAYFGPLLAHYQGMRREEFCGLATEDVIVGNGPHPYIHVAFNAFRRLKNFQSVRNLALHPELIRLGFLEYLTAIRMLGYDRLFPDLFSPSTRSPLGDRLYDELLPAFRVAGFTTHQVRHFFGNELKQRQVSAEFRADLLGHGGSTETTERYCNPTDIAVQLPDLMKLPVLTAPLEKAPTLLIPWVKSRQVAPWSHARRRPRS